MSGGKFTFYVNEMGVHTKKAELCGKKQTKACHTCTLDLKT